MVGFSGTTLLEKFLEIFITIVHTNLLSCQSVKWLPWELEARGEGHKDSLTGCWFERFNFFLLLFVEVS